MATISISQPSLDRKKITIFLLDHIIEVCLVILVVGLAFYANGFLTWANWMNILRSNSLKGVIAFGMTMVIIAGLVDLSVSSMVGLAGVIVALSCRGLSGAGLDLNIACIIGISLALLLGVAVGWIHGVSQHKTGMPAFIVTLVTWNALYGLAGLLSGGYPIANQFPEWFNRFGGGELAG
jgi:ribose/xylose/arabinose/galactoside ABC-type transport system permease subunit